MAEVVNLLKKESLSKPNYALVKKQWDSISNKLILEINNILPFTKGLVKNIIIHPTKFGTTVTFSRAYKKSSDIEMYLREDCGIGEITEAVLSHLTRDKIYTEFDGLWQESELLVDFLIIETNIQTLLKTAGLKKYTPTMNVVRAKQNAKLLKESDDFYKKLGLFFSEQIFELKTGKKYIYLGKRQNTLITVIYQFLSFW